MSDEASAVFLPECVVLMFLGCQISLVIRSVTIHTSSTDKAPGTVAAGAECSLLSLKEVGEGSEGMGCWGRLLGGGRAGDGEKKKGFAVEATFLSLPHSCANQGAAL